VCVCVCQVKLDTGGHTPLRRVATVTARKNDLLAVVPFDTEVSAWFKTLSHTPVLSLYPELWSPRRQSPLLCCNVP
jgi:hypothetical protein